MTRGVGWFLAGSCIVVALAGCQRSWFAEREPWRRDAEIACLKSGAVKESPSVVMISPINGPGMCGADFPLKVAALGESGVLGYDDEPLRPPGGIPQGGYSRPVAGASQYPGNSPFQVNPNYPHDTSLPPTGSAAPDYYRPEPPAAPLGPPRNVSAPMPITPPGAEPDEPYGAPPRGYPSPASAEPLPRYPSNGEPIPMSPSRGGPPVASSADAALKPAATLACPMVSALDRWIAEAVQPAAQKWFNQPVVEIKQISAYSCRGMNGNPNAKISEHAFGNALDIAGFTLGDGHHITVQGGWKGTAEEQGFLHDVQLAACEQFTTVLAPGSNVYHYNHIHVDLMRHASGRRICQPAAIPGDVVAARVRARYAGKADMSVTGSIAPRRLPSLMRRLSDRIDSDDAHQKLPLAIAGED